MPKTWKLLDPPPQSFYEEHPELPAIVANLLYHRGIINAEKIDEFLNPDYTQDIHDPFLFREMGKAVERIFQAIENQEKITVHGDYDADGVCSSAILITTLKALDAEHTDVFLPHREIDGYGLNKNTVQLLSDQKTNLIITCDCGVSNLEEMKLAKEKGMDVIITDHHSAPQALPEAYAVIHPLAPGETYPDKGLCGAGVAFKLTQALLKKHKENGKQLKNNESHEGFEKWLLGFVAIATVADMVPLLGESRTLTKYGLIVLNKTKSIGLQKLLLEAKLMEEDGSKKRDFDTYTIGFKIAPRINAAGRMNHANVAYNLLMTTDPTEAADLAFELNENNQERQKTTEVLVKKAIEQVELNQKDSPVLFILGTEWPTGIIGLIAGKIKEKYYKPTIVMGLNEGEITGSGRSIENFSIIEALQSMPEYFAKFGGHPMACGFTLKDEAALEPFKQAMIARFKKQFGDAPPQPTVFIDAEVDLEHVNWELYDILSKFEPFGQNNEKPKYLARELTITSINPVGKDKRHLTIMVSHHSAKIKKTIGWNLCSENGETNWCKILKKNDKIDLIFEIDVNEWNGNRELQLTIIDLKKSCNTDMRINADDADNADIDNKNDDNDKNRDNSEKIENNGKLIYEDLTYKINGILFSVHNKLGRYCNEKQICDAIEEELKINNMSYEREKILPPSFAGEKSGRNRIDFLIEDKIIIEAKTIRFVGKEEYYQCMRYLEALNKKLCLLVNFRDKQLRIKRILNPNAKI